MNKREKYKTTAKLTQLTQFILLEIQQFKITQQLHYSGNAHYQDIHIENDEI